MGVEFWVGFVVFGVFVNICSTILLHFVKQFIAFGFTPEDIIIFINFCENNRQYIQDNVTKKQKLLYRIMYFIPYYTCYLNLINIYYCIKLGGAKGIVIGKVKSEQFRIYPLINFNLNYK